MKLLELTQPFDFFRSKVANAASSLGIELAEETEFYIVNLLCDFINPASLEIDKGMGVLDTPLAFMLKKALESSPDMQIKVYKRLGDTSLYFAGYFQQYFNRRTFDASYYIDMGSTAYDRTAHLMRSHRNDSHFYTMYQSLSQDFKKLVTVLTEVSDSVPPAGDKDIVSVYLRWQQTHSDTLRRVLEDEGLVPLPSTLNKEPI